jgi:predicted Rossmann fold nucleotide-binding protein DprA/Smf involved in DNA uptake
VGREEASADLKAKIAGLLSGEPPKTIKLVASDLLVGSDKRAVSGSVKPTIERMIAESGRKGVTAEEILKATGFKPNSVRGTLWTLGSNGFAVKRNGRWVSAEAKE